MLPAISAVVYQDMPGAGQPDGPAKPGIHPYPALIDGKLPPDILEATSKWITLNTEALLAYWQGSIGTLELAAALRKV